MSTGAFGYLLRDRVLRGAAGPPVRLTDLSGREREVLALAAEGCSDRAIAERLVVTDRTVGTHMRSIFRKLQIPESTTSHRRVLAVLAYLRSPD